MRRCRPPLSVIPGMASGMSIRFCGDFLAPCLGLWGQKVSVELCREMTVRCHHDCRDIGRVGRGRVRRPLSHRALMAVRQWPPWCTATDLSVHDGRECGHPTRVSAHPDRRPHEAPPDDRVGETAMVNGRRGSAVLPPTQKTFASPGCVSSRGTGPWMVSRQTRVRTLGGRYQHRAAAWC